MTRLVTLVLLALSCHAVLAETVYIRDTLYVPLRGGQSIEHRILHRGLKSGTQLERLETNDETGFSRVRTADGLEGWLQTQYLVDEPIASTQLEDMQQQLESLEAEHQQTLLRLREAMEQNEALTSAEQTATEQNADLTEELARINELAANVIEIDETNKQLTEEQDSLMTEIDALVIRNDELSTDSTQRWFLTGAGTILIGLLFGFWVGRRVYTRRSASGWS